MLDFLRPVGTLLAELLPAIAGYRAGETVRVRWVLRDPGGRRLPGRWVRVQERPPRSDLQGLDRWFCTDPYGEVEVLYRVPANPMWHPMSLTATCWLNPETVLAKGRTEIPLAPEPATLPGIAPDPQM